MTQDAPLRARSLSSVTALDLLAGGSILLLGILGWASLALADLGHHTLLAVLLVTFASVVVIVAALARWARPQLAADRGGLAIALLCAAVAAVLSFPGFAYGVTDKDPGGYVSHAIAISNYHDVAFTDPLLATAAKDPTFPVVLTAPGARFAAIWVHDYKTGEILPQFYHLWPSLLATSYDAAGLRGLTNTVPLVALVSTLLLCAILRRVGEAMAGRKAGLVAAGAGGLLMATNMLQVWLARYPTTEMLAQALYLGALLGIIVALQTQWRPAAGIAGLLVGVSWLNRADGLLLVLISVGIGCALIGTRRWGPIATWFAGGLAVVLPHATYQAYVLAKGYTLGNGLPTLSKLTVLVVAMVVIAAVGGLVLKTPIAAALGALEKDRVQRWIGALFAVGATGLMGLGFLRPRLFGFDYTDYNGRQIHSYDEAIMHRLSWFFTKPGMLLFLVGLAVLVIRRWSAAIWTVVLPSVALFTVYAYSAKNSTRLLWWSRRYVPTVLPALVMMMALAIAFFAVHRFRGRALMRVPSVIALAGLLAVFLSQSLPLRKHNEWKGSFAISAQIAALSGGKQGIFLWTRNQPCCLGSTALFATPVWLQRQQLSSLLPADSYLATDPRAQSNLLARYHARFPGQPLFVVGSGGVLPKGIDPRTVSVAASIKTTLPFWEESDVRRPSKEIRVAVDITVWKVRSTPGG